MPAADLGYRHLSRGLLVTPLGVTCASGRDHSTPEDGDLLDGLRSAVAHGATLLDTADFHGNGHAERVIGRFLRELPDDAPLQLSSKVGRIRGSAPHPYAGRHIHHQYEQSVENLYAESIGIYTLDSFDFGPGDRYLGTAIESMHTLRRLGSIQAVGMRGPCVDYTATPQQTATHVERFLYLFRLIKPDVIWTPFNALTPSVLLEGEDLFTFTARRGVGLVLAAPLAHGILTRQPSSGAAFWRTIGGFAPHVAETMTSGFCALRARFGTAPGTLTRVALRFGLQRGEHCAVVAGFSNGRQVAENYRCLAGPLTQDELSFVDEVYAGFRACISAAAERSSVEHARA